MHGWAVADLCLVERGQEAAHQAAAQQIPPRYLPQHGRLDVGDGAQALAQEQHILM